jgi:putative transposase
MPRYVRARIPGGTFFFTVSVLERRRALLTAHIEVLGECIRRVREARPFRMEAIVVLPDHLHCIWTLPEGDAEFSGRWHSIKAGFARRTAPGEALSARRRNKGERGIWHRRFWEHAIRDERDFAHHVDYLHFNPVKHGHVARVCDWPHSSFHRFVCEGRYPLEWAAAADPATVHEA